MEVYKRLISQSSGIALFSWKLKKRVTLKIQSTDDAQRRLPSVLLELPVSVVEWAYLSGLEPSRDAVEVEGVL
jgi:hypothetical protein